MKFPHLTQTSLFKALSPLGASVETPKGIFYWASRAKQQAEIDGTIGVAQDDDGTISHLPVAAAWVGEKVTARAPKGKVFGYAPIPGIESLRTKWLARMTRECPQLVQHASLPVVTNGITHSIALASRMLLSTGDVLVTADKSWENYEHIFTGIQGLKVVTFPLFHGHGELHLDGMIGTCREVAQHHKKVVLLLNFPHNQTGFMPTKEQAQAMGHRLEELAKSMPEVNFVIILDDAYEGYVYDGKGVRGSILPYVFNTLPNFSLVKLDGISKVMLAYGYRVGFITYFVNALDGKIFDEAGLKGMRDDLTTKIGGLVRGEISQVNHHGQIMADALMDDLATVEKQCGDVIAMLGERWEIMMEELEKGYAKYGTEKMWADPCNGGFFCFVNCGAGIDPMKIADRLLVEKKVGIVPCAQGLRVAFAGVAKAKVPRMIQSIFEVMYS